MHVQNYSSSSYNQASCVRILGTASVLASLQWPHSKVGISRSITPQSERRARKHCRTHAGVQAACCFDCDECRAVGGRTVFQGGLNSKTVWTTGSLFTWKGAQKPKQQQDLQTASRRRPPHPRHRLCSCRNEENKLICYVVWGTTSLYRWGHLHVLWLVLSNLIVKVITHRRSLWTRRTRHPGLPKSPLQNR